MNIQAKSPTWWVDNKTVDNKLFHILKAFKRFLQQFLKVQDADGNDEEKDSITM